ncbi:MAG TPA: HutD family protein [Planctomycetota bacterium]|nr:HutD family protein [Planctomycetota bacterium]
MSDSPGKPAVPVVIRLGDQPITRWRNGGGSTRQIAIDPPGAGLASEFRWRVSRAQVASDGPFSVLPGVDRSLWLLRGNGMRLDVGGSDVVIDRVWQRFDFAGEATVMARLLDGPCEDLNVMTARGKVAADARVVTVLSQQSLEVPAAAQRLVVVLVGTVDAERGCVLGGGDALRLDGPGELSVRSMAEPARLLVVRFAALAG